ncbi:MAG: nucleotide exchange factor GrpE [Oscillospiraceae bacterium]
MSEENKDIINEKEDTCECASEQCGSAECDEQQNSESCEKQDSAQPMQEEKKKKKHERESDKIKEETQKLKKEIEDSKERLLRIAAEYDNYRKRTDREKSSSVRLGTVGAVEKMLPVLDTLELAADAETADEQYKKGVEMTLTMFRDALSDLGVEEIEGIGAEFNPTYHCAVARVPSEEFDSGTVASVMRKGYRLGERVIRPSMVAVVE